MVFCSCRQTTTSTSTKTTTSPKKQRFSFFRRQKPLAYISTDLEDPDDIPPTPSELKQLKSIKKSKANVDRVLYRNRHSGRKTLLSGDGVVLFSGFMDFISRKRLTEKQQRGERYDPTKDKEGPPNNSGVWDNETFMLSRVQKIDPVKSGFMGKKTDRDEETGCAAGTLVAAHWAGRKVPSRPKEKEVLVTPRKGTNSGCGGVDDSFATVSTGCSPMSNKSVSFMEENSPDESNANRPNNNEDVVAEEDGWCGAFGSSIPTEEDSERQIDATTSEPIEDYSKNASAATDEESVWCDVFNTSIITEGEAVTTDDALWKAGEGDKENDPNAKIRGIRNVEVVFEERKSLLKRVSTLRRKKKEEENPYDQLQ
eukprot:scaffold3245_cov181-Skeletonema_menzelii.AAC.1